MARPLEVLSIIDAPVVTGPARGLIHLGRHLPPSVHLNIIMLRGAGAGPVPRLDEAAKGRLRVFELQESRAFDPMIFWRALTIAREIGAEVVQSHSYKPHVIAGFLRLALGLKWVGHHHGWTAENSKVKLYHRVDSLTLPRAHKVVAVADSARKIVVSEGVKPENVVLILNAVDLEDLQTEHSTESARKLFELEDGVTYACCVGRLSFEKGQDVLLQAVGLIKDKAEKFCVMLAGDGPDREKLEALVTELKIGHMVKFLGHQKKVATVYRASDFMIMPSRSEAMPNVLLESNALGVPVIATRVGGVPEVAEDGVTAWIVPSESPQGLADAIMECLTKPTERAQRAQRARVMVNTEHDPRRRAERYVATYESLLNRSLQHDDPVADARAAARPRGGSLE